nr:MAG TPA: hypothetical protein [Caudoviricetes sp.]
MEPPSDRDKRNPLRDSNQKRIENRVNVVREQAECLCY